MGWRWGHYSEGGRHWAVCHGCWQFVCEWRGTWASTEGPSVGARKKLDEHLTKCSVGG